MSKREQQAGHGIAGGRRFPSSQGGSNCKANGCFRTARSTLRSSPPPSSPPATSPSRPSFFPSGRTDIAAQASEPAVSVSAPSPLMRGLLREASLVLRPHRILIRG